MKKTYTLLLIFLVFSITTFAQDDMKNFNEKIFIVSRECKAIFIEFRTGKLSTTDSEPINIICSPDNSLPILNCIFSETKSKKLIAEKNLTGGIFGQQGFISSDSNADVIFLNFTSQIVSIEQNIVFKEGLVRGKKICSGIFRLESEIKK